MPKISIEEAKNVAVGTMLQVTDSMGRTTKADLLDVAKRMLARLGHDADPGPLLERLLRQGTVLQIGDEFVVSERGRVMINIVTAKVEVARALGENKVAFDGDDHKRLKEASTDVPG